MRTPKTTHRSNARHNLTRRGFASVGEPASFDGKRNEDSHTPESSMLDWPSNAKPTPYDIFHMTKKATYSKARYYKLVKLYHPDRHHHTAHDGIPHRTKLERYRLVVAANNILSDPVKRRLYDLYGAGWAGESDMRRSYSDLDKSWRQQPGNASMNATWEDWEKWYQERDGKKQEPVFMSNGAFVAVVLVFVAIGSWGQVTRMGNHSVHLVEMQEEKHESISKALHLRRAENSGKSREERIQKFLKQREGWD
ncbi:hypothetical protein DL546_001028 [Coniochaeta pulveracea]|uniref:J domain-containing protein n=1 Tax=Coniochaeta pulveracea TaxID=177199 RepID=A0A420Y598_9PEZI|nr:hypothetical protein DL546_001028 [Coniochaeta pulveracea]